MDKTDWTPEMLEEDRLDELTSPLFQDWIEFERTFADKAIDVLDISVEDAEKVAVTMEATGTASGAAFAHLLRGIANTRALRTLCHKVDAIWLAEGRQRGMSIDEIATTYDRLPKGNA